MLGRLAVRYIPYPTLYKRSSKGSCICNDSPIERESHLWPLVTLLGGQGDRVGRQEIKTQQSTLPLLNPYWTQHQLGIQP